MTIIVIFAAHTIFLFHHVDRRSNEEPSPGQCPACDRGRHSDIDSLRESVSGHERHTRLHILTICDIQIKDLAIYEKAEEQALATTDLVGHLKRDSLSGPGSPLACCR